RVFFFQAEDGIRDYKVTGVQTCALPISLDGKIATRSGDSKWISNEASRHHVHELRGRMDAIVVGIGTVLADDPLLTARPPGPRKIGRASWRERGENSGGDGSVKKKRYRG